VTNVFVLNVGSSSIKYQVLDVESGEVFANGLVERIGVAGSDVPDHAAGLERVLGELDGLQIDAVGHRIVHGGPHFVQATVIDDVVEAGIEAISDLAPLHNPKALAAIDAARRCQCVALDCYPYTAGSTMLHDDPVRLQGRVLIAHSEPEPGMAGRDLDDIAREWGCSKLDAVKRLQPASAIYFMMDEADVQRILAYEPTMIGSDGIPLGPKPHPRLWGTFPRVLGRYSRELKLFPLETAVWKMTGLTAGNFGLEGRGTIAEGAWADLVVFDPDAVIDTATYEDPQRPAAGIDTVVVNGVPVWQAGQGTGARPGQVLRPRPPS